MVTRPNRQGKETAVATMPEFIDLVRATPTEPRSGEGDMVVLRDGRLFFAYASFRKAADNAVADIVARTSADGGRSWTAPSVLIPHREARENVMSVSLRRTAAGRLLLFYLRKDSISECRAWLRQSTDEAQTWGEAVCCTPATRYHVIVNNCAVQLRDGRLVLPYEVCDAVWTKDERISAAAAVSDDEGRSWRSSNEIYAPKRGAMEARVIERRDGSLWMLMRTDQGTLWESSSADRGLTWGRHRAVRVSSRRRHRSCSRASRRPATCC